jgi:predicted nucleotidyltransferase
MPRRSRPARVLNHHSSALRSELAQTAARLIAEDGMEYGAAKKKAVRQLGLPENFPLPGNDEIQDAVRDYHAIYQEEEQAERLAWLRSVAVDLLRLLDHFSPYLTGSVLDGTATRHSRIDLLLFPDSAKEVEIFLLNAGIRFRHGTPRSERVEAVLMLEDEDTPANLIVLQPREERIHFKGADGRSRTRAKLDSVVALLRSENA